MFTDLDAMVGVLALIIIGIGGAGIILIWNDAENDDDSGYTL